MTNRARDWFAQAERDLEQAGSSRAEERHEWACFAAQQSAEKGVKALHLTLGQEAWGHVVARLLRELPILVIEELIEKGKVLDNFFAFPPVMQMGIQKEHLSNTMGHCRVGRPFDMPVRSLSSSVFIWPDRTQVDKAIRAWVVEVTRQRPELLRAGYFGSYAWGDWGVGSDLDLVAVVQEAAEQFERRSLTWDLSSFPVPAELLIYTEDEWHRLQMEGGRFARMLAREAVWVYPEDEKG